MRPRSDRERRRLAEELLATPESPGPLGADFQVELFTVEFWILQIQVMLLL